MEGTLALPSYGEKTGFQAGEVACSWMEQQRAWNPDAPAKPVLFPAAAVNLQGKALKKKLQGAKS